MSNIEQGMFKDEVKEDNRRYEILLLGHWPFDIGHSSFDLWRLASRV
jgi:hypothetical protein